MSMLAATYTQGARFAVEEVEIPEAGPDEILVRVMASSICGTDMRIIQHGHRKLRQGQRIVLGHEFAGAVERAGERTRGLEPGARVAIAPNIGCGHCDMCVRGLTNMCPDYEALGISLDGAHAEFVRVPARYLQQGNVCPLPEGVGWLEATLVEPLACVVNSMRVCRPELGDAMVIFGAGPIGLLHMMLGHLRGCARVVLVDPNQRRLERALALGAAAVVGVAPGAEPEATNAEILRATGGGGANVVVTACSVASVQEQALGVCAPYARVCLFGGLPKDSSQIRINSNEIHYKSINVGGMTGGSLADFRTALRLVAARRVDVRQVISHVVPTPEMGRAFELSLSGETAKVAINQPNGQRLK